MIAAVKGWHAALGALLFFPPPGAAAAEDLNSAARELARKTAAFAGRGEPVSVTWRNASSLGSPEFNQVRGAFEDAVREAGARVTEVVPVAEAHLRLSENQTQYLLVEEIRKGDDRQVWIAAWKHSETAAPGNIAPGVALEKKLVWEQNEPILDAVFPAGNLLVLSPTKVTLYARQNGQWEPRQSVPLALPPTGVKPWPRDVRGHLRLNGASFQAYLPGLAACGGSVEPVLVMDCRPTDEPWVLESGSRAMLLAAFSPARNYFDGRVTTQTGLRKTVAPFYSAASVEEQGRQLWLLAMVDGRTQIFDSGFDSVGGVAGWGSDIAGTEARCGGGFQVLATKAGDAREPDSIRAFTLVNRVPAPLTAPVEFPGPITALWSAGAGSALAVAYDLATNRNVAYLVTVVCGS